MDGKRDSSPEMVALTVVIPQNALLLRLPVPDHDGAILRSRHDVTVLVDVRFGARNARDNIKVAVNHLRYTRWNDNEQKLPAMLHQHDRLNTAAEGMINCKTSLHQ